MRARTERGQLAAAEAERIIRESWQAVEAIADELLAAPPRTTPPRALELLDRP